MLFGDGVGSATSNGPRSPAGTCYLVGLGEMYVADPRFSQNYDRHGQGTAVLVRDALQIYAERNLSEALDG